jgi:hypothetical protein
VAAADPTAAAAGGFYRRPDGARFCFAEGPSDFGFCAIRVDMEHFRA